MAGSACGSVMTPGLTVLPVSRTLVFCVRVLPRLLSPLRADTDSSRIFPISADVTVRLPAVPDCTTWGAAASSAADWLKFFSAHAQVDVSLRLPVFGRKVYVPPRVAPTSGVPVRVRPAISGAALLSITIPPLPPVVPLSTVWLAVSRVRWLPVMPAPFFDTTESSIT